MSTDTLSAAELPEELLAAAAAQDPIYFEDDCGSLWVYEYRGKDRNQWVLIYDGIQ